MVRRITYAEEMDEKNAFFFTRRFYSLLTCMVLLHQRKPLPTLAPGSLSARILQAPPHRHNHCHQQQRYKLYQNRHMTKLMPKSHYLVKCERPSMSADNMNISGCALFAVFLQGVRLLEVLFHSSNQSIVPTSDSQNEFCSESNMFVISRWGYFGCHIKHTHKMGDIYSHMSK